MKRKDSKTIELQKFVLNLSQKLDTRSFKQGLNMLILKTYLFITPRKPPRTVQKPETKNNSSNEFELPGCSYSVSGTQEYVEYIIENMKH